MTLGAGNGIRVARLLLVLVLVGHISGVAAWAADDEPSNNLFVSRETVSPHGQGSISWYIEGATPADTVLGAFDEADHLIVYDDDGGPGSGSALGQVSVNTDGSIHLKVTGWKDLDFDGMKDSNPSEAHTADGLFDLYVAVYDGEGSFVEVVGFPGPHELFPGGVLVFDVEAPGYPSDHAFDAVTINLIPGRDPHDYMTFSNPADPYGGGYMALGAPFEAAITYSTSETLLLGWFGDDGSLRDSCSMAKPTVPDLPWLIGEVPLSGEINLGVSGPPLDPNFTLFDGYHGAWGDYTLEVFVDTSGGDVYDLNVAGGAGNGTIDPSGHVGRYYCDGARPCPVVTLTAQPATNWRVVGWSDTDNDGSTSMTNTVTMDRDRTVSVDFEQITQSLTVTVGLGEGTVSPTSGDYPTGETVTLTATPAVGWRVLAWHGSDDDTSASETNAAMMDSSKVVSVDFEQIPISQHALTAGVVGGHGTIALTPAGGVYDEGTVVTLSLSLDAGYRLLGWHGTDNDGALGDHTVTMTGDKTVTVDCELVSGSLTAGIFPPAVVSAGAQWHIGDSVLHNSGEVITRLAPGPYTVHFTGVTGWTSPSTQVATVVADQTASVTGNYVQAQPSEPEKGALRVVLSSSQGSVDPSAAWRITGGEWRASGYTLTGLEAAVYGVEFHPVAGWTAPANTTAAIGPGQTTVVSGTYMYINPQPQPQKGLLTVYLLNETAAELGAWRVNGGEWRGSGQTMAQVDAGSYTVDFREIEGGDWLAPGALTVQVHTASHTEKWATYRYVPDTVYVSTEGSDQSGDGSEERPYQTIQKGINVVPDDGTVLVMPGVYSGSGNFDLDTKGKAITVASLEGPDTCTIDCQGSAEITRRGFYIRRGEGDDTIIEGFTIAGGYANVGGGIFCSDGSSPTIKGCVVKGNTSRYSGGGIRCNDSSPTIVDCIVSDNTAEMTGGGIFCDGASSPLIIYGTLTGNFAQGCGGAIYCFTGSSPDIVNCVIAGNSTNSCGGGIYCATGSLANIINCTISSNVANIGGGIRCYNAQAEIENSILWGNAGLQYGNQIATYQSEPNIAYCDIQGSGGSGAWDEGLGNDRGGNLDINPSFVSPRTFDESGDYHLRKLSPCIDAGNPLEPCIEPAPNGDRLNMGAYGNTLQATCTLDYDQDGLGNPVEVRWGLDPCNVDTDDDGLSDYQEVTLADDDPNSYDPYDIATASGGGLNAAVADTDGDGVSDYDEVGYDGDASKYDPYKPNPSAGGDLNALAIDTDGDGMSDLFETQYASLDPLDPNDAAADPDGDGFDNLSEFLGGSNPEDPNSVPPPFMHDLDLVRVRYSDQAQSYLGAVRLSVEPPAGKVVTGVSLTFPDQSVTTLPVVDPLAYDQRDFLASSGDPLYLSEVESKFPAGSYTIELTYDDHAHDAVTFDHWYSTYPDFPNAVAPVDGQMAVAPELTIVWDSADASGLEIVDSDLLTTAYVAGVPLGARSNVVGEGVLSEDKAYELRLTNDNSLAPFLASASYVRFDTFLTRRVFYVDRDASGANDGTSWAGAYNDLQDALTDPCLSSGDEIWVAAGVYSPGGQASDTFQLVPGVSVYGGFGGGETRRTQRDPNANLTVLGDYNRDIPSGVLLATDVVMPFLYHVVTGADNSELDGFTITAGGAYGTSPDDSGAGVYCPGTSPTISNCIITGNSATNGGAIYCDGGGQPVLVNCQITGNSAKLGGAVCVGNADVKLVNCVIAGNSAEDGGAVYGYRGVVNVLNCTIADNRAEFFGGALFGWEATLGVTNSILWDNTAGSGAQIALGEDTHLAASYSDIQGGSDAVHREAGSTLTWDVGNIERGPRFVGVDDYRLGATSHCIDAGDNEAIVDYDTDIAGNARVYNNAAVDIGAYEHIGPKLALTPDVIEIEKMKVKAGNKRDVEPSDSFKISGISFDITPEDFAAEDMITIELFNAGSDTAIFSEGFVVNAGNLKANGKYSYPGGDGVKSFKFNMNGGRFSVSGKKVDLSGLSSPVELQIDIGDFNGIGSADETIINGPHKSIPEELAP